MKSEEVFKKLRFDKTKVSLVLCAPSVYTDLLDGIQFDSVYESDKTGRYDFVQIFASTQAELEQRCLETKMAGKYDCLFWVCYPKGTGKIKSDIKRETVWKALALIGLETVTQIALDETWSALRARPVEKVGKPVNS